MSVTAEELMALVDGELSPEDAARVEAAIAADPELARRLDAERGLRETLRGHFAPVAREPVPDALTDMIARAAAEEAEEQMTDSNHAAPAQVLDFASARSRREEAEKARRKAERRSRAPIFADRRMAFAIAASLVLGLMLGTRLHSEGPITSNGDRLVASGTLAKGLDRTLASAGGDGDLRILTSFRRSDGGYCRVFEARAATGIACKDDRDWVLERTMKPGDRAAGTYRQAGSAGAALLAAAQEMAAGEPLDAAQESAARERNWR
ncbi:MULTISPECIES: anti-sigma factor family protein [unclassified Novosphingobium]|uniref:anti-sigma factor family protein n=1 Tax=unclassified Novosphingobium TaxID=2644732 RepID=UPI0012C77F61|nr:MULTISPECIES: zf-HC2 domain-containing protein [unclassified Novosphingobium]MPS68257.1 hypothetical protein [Novosphingobium sp.]WRT95695.1 zf-HC2 domain-containing protein [Novosphingobium sp. RL4]